MLTRHSSCAWLASASGGLSASDRHLLGSPGLGGRWPSQAFDSRAAPTDEKVLGFLSGVIPTHPDRVGRGRCMTASKDRAQRETAKVVGGQKDVPAP